MRIPSSNAQLVWRRRRNALVSVGSVAAFAAALAGAVALGSQQLVSNMAAARGSSPLDSIVPALMEQYHVPGVAVAVLESGELRSVRTFGFADHLRMHRVDSATVFQAASLGKPLFAYAVLARDGQGGWSIDTPVEQYSPSRLAEGSERHRITIAHLLSHTSGLVYSEAEGRRRMIANPGSQWQYSGLGYVVLQAAFEHASGSTLDHEVGRVVARPAGMTSTSYAPLAASRGKLAEGHDRRGDPLVMQSDPAPSAASSLHTTIADYARFIEHVYADLRDTAGVAERMMRPRIAVDTSLGLSWGLGWAVAHAPGETLFLHWGSNPGFKALVIGSVERSKALVVLTNADHGLELAVNIVPAVLGRRYDFLQFYMLHPDD
jgi:CubicO group peptidase (beta-lactamase class C family)